jgi:hypothetical protein
MRPVEIERLLQPKAVPRAIEPARPRLQGAARQWSPPAGVSGHIAVAAILLLTYRSDGLALGLGSRAVSAAVLAALGLALAAPSPPPRSRPRTAPHSAPGGLGLLGSAVVET